MPKKGSRKQRLERAGRSLLAHVCVWVMAAVMLAFSSCEHRAEEGRQRERTIANSDIPSEPNDAGIWKELAIESNTQAHVDNVAIGTGNFWEAEYTIADGSKLTGQSCYVFVSVKDDPAGGRSIRVGQGSSFMAGPFSFEVMDVSDDTIHLRYKQADANH